ncbi:hypothetical protein MUG84_01760 [Paenibacillus sp. KQZ6P-2]|uniref:Uncharacterized protein n=1 Tax=Paenibacillus mangrovi TaxID=2931978 RepID=A0A9X1WL14_9BACL|nr:hypothetical protein [Paenibacillus mangrovi]MCJ8010466.1 hypothetical protein [Paenibacillus mangrovi]
MHHLKPMRIEGHKRKLLSAALSAALLLPLASHVQAAPSQQIPPEMLSYTTMSIPNGAVYEHDDNQMMYAAIQGDQVRITAIGAYGQIKPITSFSKQNLEYISSFHGTRDHGFLIAGGNIMMKIGPSGKLEWDYSSSSTTPSGLIRSAIQLKDNSYIAALKTPADMANTSKLRLIHFSADGKVIQEQEFPGVVFDNVDTLTPLSGGGFALSAESVSETGQEQVFVAKWDADLNLIWQNRFDPAEDTQNLWITAMSEGNNGDLALAGYYNHPNPDGGYRYLTSGYAMSVRQDGSLQWVQKPDASLDRSMLNDIQPAPDGGYMATGTVNQDWHGTVSKQFVWKLGDDGTTKWNKIINRTTFNSGLFIQPLHISGQKDTALLLGTADGTPTLIKIGYLKNP